MNTLLRGFDYALLLPALVLIVVYMPMWFLFKILCDVTGITERYCAIKHRKHHVAYTTRKGEWCTLCVRCRCVHRGRLSGAFVEG